ncbi:MAG: hypothetical protein ACRDIY_01875 [Chloroflexota bacterium]
MLDVARMGLELAGFIGLMAAMVNPVQGLGDLLGTYHRRIRDAGQSHLLSSRCRTCLPALVAHKTELFSAMRCPISAGITTSTDTVFLLESLLRRYVYGRPLELKRDRELCAAVVFVLDLLVENGSSPECALDPDDLPDRLQANVPLRGQLA